MSRDTLIQSQVRRLHRWPASPQRPWMGLLAVAAIVGVATLLPTTLFGQASTPSQTPAADAAIAAQEERSLRDRYRRVFFYQSEAARLVPPDYRPVALDDLEALLERPAEGTGPAVDRPQLVRAVYVASLEENVLRSQRSTLEIRYHDDAVGHLDLGPVNLALNGKPLDGNGSDGEAADEQDAQQPRLVSTAAGTLRAVVSRDCRIDFAWSLGGRPLSDGTRRYEMVIPRCGQSRILIDLPTTHLLLSSDGVARMLPSPPPEARVSGAEPPVRRWYEIEAGGLSRVELHVFPSGRQQGETVLPIRQQTIDYQIGPSWSTPNRERARGSAVHWTMQLVLDAIPGAPLPPLEVGRGRATEVLLAGEPVRWTESIEQDQTVLRFSSDTLVEGRGNPEAVTLTVNGASELTFDQPLPLPWPRWLECRVVHVSPMAETQLRVDPSIALLQAQTPEHWLTQPMIVSESGTKIYRWSGSPGDATPTVRISSKRDALTADAALRLVVRDDVIQGRWETVVAVDQRGPQPLRLQVQKDWRVDSVTLPASGRVVDAVIGDGTPQWIEVWPEQDDVREGQIRLQVLGKRIPPAPPAPRAAGRAWRIPGTWFVRLANSRTASAAAIIPPPGFRWSGSTALRGSVPSAEGLSGAIGDMLGPVPSGALLFDLPTGTTPPLELEQQLPPFEVDVELALDADEGELFETLSVLCRTPSPELNEVRVRSGEAQGRPPLVWSVEAVGAASAAGSLAMPVTARRDESTAAEEGESWLIALPASLSGDVRLIGRRRYPLAGSQAIDLPSVPQAATQRTSVVISPRLMLESTVGPVLRLPRGGPADEGARHLRYDPSEPATITVAAADAKPGVALAWQSDVDYFVSTRSGDDVFGQFQIVPGRPLRIAHDPHLRLVRAEIDGAAAAEGRVLTTDSSVSIASEGKSQTARLHWWRPTPAGATGRVFRPWQPPQVEVQGVVLRQRHRVWAAPDTVMLPLGAAAWPTPLDGSPAPVAPAPPWLPDSLSAADQPIVLQDQAGKLWVMPAEAAWGLATAIALAVFAIAWAVALRTPLAVAVAAAGLLLIAVAWPLWALTVVGFLVAPAIAAGLLAVSLRRTPQRSGPLPVDGGSPSRLATRAVGVVLLAALLGSGAAARLRAQAPPAVSPSAADSTAPMAAATAAPAADAQQALPDAADSFAILIPVDALGEMAGTKVYVPETLYSALFRRWRSGEPAAEVLMRRAEYRVRIGASIEGRSVDAVRIEARLELEMGPANAPVRLPLPPAAVRDVEIVVGGEAKAIRWFPADQGIFLQLPRAGLAQLRVTIVPQKTVDVEGIHHVQMPIPPMADAELTIDSDAPLDLLELEPALGSVDALAPAGRLFAELGPVRELAFRWRFRRNEDVQSLPLVRRWWVHAAMDRTVAECEIQPPGAAMAPGEDFQLDVFDPVLPLVVSTGWSLVESTSIGPMQSRLRLRSRRLAPGPVRLMWEIPQARDGADLAEGRPLSLPSVRPVRTVDLGPTLLAIDADSRLQVSLVEPASSSEIERDHFLAGWSGYKGAAQRALTLTGGPPRLVIRGTNPLPWRSSQRQHLHVTRGRLHLEMAATVHPGGSGCGPLRLIMPARMEVHRLIMGGVPVTASALQGEQYQELPLPDPPQGEPLEILFSGSLPLPASGQFQPPCVRLPAAPVTTGSYLVTRDTEVEVSEIQPTSLPVSDSTLSDGRRLAGRRVPRWSWQLDASTAQREPHLPGSYQVRDNPTTTDASQLSTLIWEDGRWSMETLIRITSQSGRPDFFSVELPAQWTEELQVEPAGSSWSRQPSTDESIHLVQILPLDTAAGQHVLRIRGRLASSDTGRVVVPDLRLLGNGLRQRFFAVPKRLTSDPINWLTTGARQRDVPATLAAAVPSGDSHATYEITGRNWSAKLLPTTTSAGSARATALDIQLFPQPDDRCLALCRWDLLPAGADQVQLVMPRSVTVHAAWSNGLPARMRVDGTTVTVPLNLSRLAQPVVLLVEFADISGSQPVPVPRLLDIPVASTWIARYAERATLPDVVPQLQQPWVAASAAERRSALAESALAALDGSLERLAERSNEEKANWLAPWLARVHQLRPAAVDDPLAAQEAAAPRGATPDADASPAADGAPPATTPIPEDDAAAWERLAERMEAYVERVLGASEHPSPDAALTGPASDLAPADWDLQWAAYQEGGARNIPATLLSPAPRVGWRVARPIFALAILFAAALTIALVGRALGRLARLPQLWLLLIGAVGLVLAPVPVAIALCLIAVTSPLLRLRATAA